MKITALETFRIPQFPLSVFLRVHTDEGLVGLGESTNEPRSVEASIHDFCAPFALGQDPFSNELIWKRIYDQSNFQGSAGAELRALSALDIALWDLKGKALNTPLYTLLGGKVRGAVPIYNTCGDHGGRITGRKDNDWFMQDAGTLAEDLLQSGIKSMKIWPLDGLARPSLGQTIRYEELRKGIEPFEKIRAAVGDRMEVALECHSVWNIPSAIRIAKALEDYAIKWIEDPILVDDVANLAALRRKINIPLLASERLFTRAQYMPLLKAEGADIVMIDLSWSGGLTEGKKIASLADAHRLPVTTHNCGGPVLTKAAAHFNISTTNSIEMETVRAIYRTFPEIIEEDIGISSGEIHLSEAPGLGLNFQKGVFERADVETRISKL
ncbi:MAG: mandelate racemase/muconate lactonizing enzyme family protein [Christensenellaceae bacterium]|nr:mandelate racemase/muconate lactonizing enzyme family protein [Christensenellaceae bacterium]